ncbi:MAG: SCO family protein [Pseudomonadota bacterium]
MTDSNSSNNSEASSAVSGLALSLALVITCTAAFGESQFDRDSALALSQAALGRSLPAVTFTDTSGHQVNLAGYQGKPLVISMIYTSCHHICPMTTRHLQAVVAKARDALGVDSFHVISIGFDTLKDSPPMMARFAEAQGIDLPGWDFLSGTQASVDSLSDTLGFQYFPSASGFDHLIQVSVIDERGRVYQQVYGMGFEPPLLIEPLKRLVYRTHDDDTLLDNLAKQVRLFCTVYDPASDRYRFDYSLFVGMFIGFLCVGTLGVVLVFEWHKTLAKRGIR